MSDVSSLRKKIKAISQEMYKADPQFRGQMEGFVEVRDVDLVYFLTSLFNQRGL